MLSLQHMEAVHVWIILTVGIIFIMPVILFRPLVVAISNRIAGKQVNTDELKALKKKVTMLEDQLMEMRGRLISVEDAQDFSRKMLEDDLKHEKK